MQITYVRVTDSMQLDAVDRTKHEKGTSHKCAKCQKLHQIILVRNIYQNVSRIIIPYFSAFSKTFFILYFESVFFCLLPFSVAYQPVIPLLVCGAVSRWGWVFEALSRWN